MPGRNLPKDVSFPLSITNDSGTYQTKVRKEQIQQLVACLNLKQNLPSHRVIRLPNLFTIHEGIDSREEGTVQPTTTLRDEFWNRVRNIRLTNRILHESQHPSLFTLGHQLPAKNTVFSEVHVGREDVCILAV